jgi:predicted DNA-binding protein
VEKVTITTRLPAELVDKLKAEKAESGRPIERILADIISEHYSALIEPRV